MCAPPFIIGSRIGIKPLTVLFSGTEEKPFLYTGGPLTKEEAAMPAALSANRTAAIADLSAWYSCSPN